MGGKIGSDGLSKGGRRGEKLRVGLFCKEIKARPKLSSHKADCE